MDNQQKLSLELNHYVQLLNQKIEEENNKKKSYDKERKQKLLLNQISKSNDNSKEKKNALMLSQKILQLQKDLREKTFAVETLKNAW